MNYLGIAAIVKDETPYLREWVAFHRAVGVDHFWIADNGSKEPVAKTLEREIEAGIVDVSDLPGRSAQLIVYNLACQALVDKTRWLACIDADEFLVPKRSKDACLKPVPHDDGWRPFCKACGVWIDCHAKGGASDPPYESVPEILRRYESANGLAVNWQCFGPNNRGERPQGLVIENYTRKAKDEWPENQHIKSIVQPAKVESMTIPHYAIYKDRKGAVNTAGDPVFGPFSRVHTDVLQLNHYITKSAQEYRFKTLQARADTGEYREASFSHLALFCSQVEDKTAMFWLDETKRYLEDVNYKEAVR